MKKNIGSFNIFALLPANFSEVRRPTNPGSLWWKLCIALNKCVTILAPFLIINSKFCIISIYGCKRNIGIPLFMLSILENFINKNLTASSPCASSAIVWPSDTVIPLSTHPGTRIEYQNKEYQQGEKKNVCFHFYFFSFLFVLFIQKAIYC